MAQLGQPDVIDDLNNQIQRWEPIIMEAALGYDFYQAFDTGVNPGSGVSIESRWEDLLNGVSFSNLSQIRKKFYGFAPLTNKSASPLAGFIYYEFQKSLFTQVTGSGIKKNDSENSSNASPNIKLANAYNDAVRQIKLFWEFMWLDSQKATPVYPEFDYRQVYDFNYGYGYLNEYWFNRLYAFESINPLF